MILSLAVQHHPARERLLEDLVPELRGGDLPLDVVTDPDPASRRRSAWRTYRLALERTPPEATHRLIVQDDARVCRDFVAGARLALEARPDAIVVFWQGGAPAVSARALHRAAAACQAWVRIPMRSWVPTVATAYPASVARELLDYGDRGYSRTSTGDDGIVTEFRKATRVEAYATVPSLVEHPDVAASLVGRHARAGRDRGRVAACWIGDYSPLEIDWSV